MSIINALASNWRQIAASVGIGVGGTILNAAGGEATGNTAIDPLAAAKEKSAQGDTAGAVLEGRKAAAQTTGSVAGATLASVAGGIYAKAALVGIALNSPIGRTAIKVVGRGLMALGVGAALGVGGTTVGVGALAFLGIYSAGVFGAQVLGSAFKGYTEGSKNGVLAGLKQGLVSGLTEGVVDGLKAVQDPFALGTVGAALAAGTSGKIIEPHFFDPMGVRRLTEGVIETGRWVKQELSGTPSKVNVSQNNIIPVAANQVSQTLTVKTAEAAPVVIPPVNTPTVKADITLTAMPTARTGIDGSREPLRGKIDLEVTAPLKLALEKRDSVPPLAASKLAAPTLA